MMSLDLVEQTNAASSAETITVDQLVEAIKRVYDGDAVFSPRLAGFVLDAFSGDTPAPTDPELDQLTAREQEVLRLIARGYTYREIGTRLHLSVKAAITGARQAGPTVRDLTPTGPRDPYISLPR